MVFMKYILTVILINLLMNGVAHASHHHDSESNKPSGDGHCAYMADNPFAGDPYRACMLYRGRQQMDYQPCKRNDHLH